MIPAPFRVTIALLFFHFSTALWDRVGTVVRAPMWPRFHQSGPGSTNVARVPPMWPGFDSMHDAIRGLSLLVLYAAQRGFSPFASSFQLLKNGKFTAMITLLFQLQQQYKMNFIYVSHHFAARADMNSTKSTSLPLCGFAANLVVIHVARA